MKRTDKDLPRLIWNWVWKTENTKLLTVLALVAVLMNILGCRMQQIDVQRAEERGREAAYAERDAAEEAVRAETFAAETAQQSQYDRKLKLLCQQVYGLYQVGARRADQMELAAWVAINRVDDTRWPDTLEEVLLQPEQWQGMSEENPVLQDIYTVCKEALDAYTTGGIRPIAPDFVYLSYENGKLSARTEYIDSASCRYMER